MIFCCNYWVRFGRVIFHQTVLIRSQSKIDSFATAQKVHDATKLYTHNADVDQINDRQLDLLPSKEYEYDAVTIETSSLPKVWRAQHWLLII